MKNDGRLRHVEEYIDAARREIARRAARAKALDPDYFVEPAWNILLDLYVGSFDRRGATPTNSVLVASQAAATTGLRYIILLEGAGEVERLPCPKDGRVTLVVLTCVGRARIEAALGAMIDAEERISSARRYSFHLAKTRARGSPGGCAGE